MQYLNIASYKFISLSTLAHLQSTLLAQCEKNALKGTILLSQEGINLTLAGKETAVDAFIQFLLTFPAFSDMRFCRSFSKRLAFKRLKVKIKDEIITFKQPHIDATKMRAISLAPTLLKQWLDSNEPITLLDTRNTYEVEWGTFVNAQSLPLNDFSELPDHLETIDKKAKIVMFCTGGIRCEKAALYMQAQGYGEVYQLEGGILNYFAQVGGKHYQGHCFVFDERIAVDTNLKEISRLG